MVRISMAVAVVLSVMLLVSINSMETLAEEQEQPTVGQRVDSAVTGVTNAFNEHGGPQAVDSVTSTIKSVSGWFSDKAKEWGIHF